MKGYQIIGVNETMKNKFQQSKCKMCGVILLEVEGTERTPCPVCGEKGRVFERQLEDTICLRDQTRMIGKHNGKGKPFFDARIGADFYFKTQKWHHLERIIDWDNDTYIETITNPETGEIIKKVEEPLSHHRGHGTAKNKK